MGGVVGVNGWAGGVQVSCTQIEARGRVAVFLALTAALCMQVGGWWVTSVLMGGRLEGGKSRGPKAGLRLPQPSALMAGARLRDPT